jgi:hypothetical protein
MRRFVFVIFTCLFFQVAPLESSDWEHTKQACNNMLRGFSRFTAEDCGLKVFGLEPIGPELKNIASGSGPGAGLHFKRQVNRNHLQSDITIRGLVSPQHFSLAEGRYELHLPTPFSKANPSGSQPTIEDQVTIQFLGHRLDLAEQDFYGLGPTSSLAGKSSYRQRELAVGGSAYVPVMTWMAVGGGLRYIDTAIKGTASSTVTTIQDVYSDAQAPGLHSQPGFLDTEAFLRFHTPAATTHTWQNHDLRLRYDHFSDRHDGTQTFDRFSAEGTARYELRVNSDNPFDRSWFQDLLCEQIAGRECRIGYFSLHGVVTAVHSAQGIVPFYFQDTLGGADFQGMDTLRGFKDYRFRAPNRVLIQAELEKPIWGPLGLYGFYDLGKVALHSSELSLTGLRHDLGVGLLLRGGGKVVLRAYVAFGSGEGAHPNVKMMNAF